MEKSSKSILPETVDQYIAGFPEHIQKVLEQIRATIKKLAPNAVESISYAMPAFSLDKSHLVYFAAFKKHIGLFSVPTENDAFKADFSGYKTGRGSIQFPLDKPMPLDLITKIVQFRMKENLERQTMKQKNTLS